MISVTNRCPARCSYCNIPNRPQREMSTEELISLFDQLKHLGTQRIALWGGEPLVRDDIGFLIDYARNRCGFFVSIDSNGYLLKKKWEAVRNLDVLVMSFDGPREVQDRNREPGSFDKVMESLEWASPLMRVFTITVLTRENLGHIDFILEQARRCGFFTSFQLLHHTKSLASDEEDTLLPSNTEYQEAIRLLIERKRQGYPIVSTIPYLRYLLKWDDYSRPTSSVGKGLICRAAQLYCNVDTDGSVYPCSCLVEQVPAKNFLDVGFEEAFRFSSRGGCQACIASCFNEYNLMHSLNMQVIWSWFQHTKKT
ncbi:radical SAM protein [Geobacter sp. SVR]|uniref:radical SAM protein n=1 Tax=Geobacter sp. SVR TaxID=2495594 RepID=UPI001EF36DA1|nr:radical SAM protein [Geobacter sp. SVR]